MATDNFGNQIPANPMTAESYWASVPDIVRETMQKVAGSPDAWPAGIKLALAGYVIDKATMVYGWNPVLVMAERMADGFKFVQSIGKEPLPGFIKVSLDATDYPAVDPPVTPPNVTDMVETQVVDGQSVPVLLWTVGNKSYFMAGPGCHDAHGVVPGLNGKKFTQDGVTYTAEVHDPTHGDVVGNWMGGTTVYMTTGA